MADTKQSLQFRKVAGMPTSGLTVGAIYFDKNTGTINVATSATAYDKFGYGVKDATWANQKLTLTKSTGEVVELDFTNVASASDLTALATRVGNIETWENTAKGEISTLQSEMDAVEAKAAANEDKLAGIAETVVKSIDAAVLVETNRAKGIEGGLDTRLGTLETKVNVDHEDRIAELEGLFTGTEGGSVQDLIDSAIETNNTTVVTPGLAAKVDTTTYEEYVETNDAAVAKAQKTADDEVTRAKAAEATIDKKIGAPIEVADKSEYSENYTVAQDIKAAKDAAAAAQADIDAFMAAADTTADALDTLKEIQDFLLSDDGTVQTLLDKVAANETAIGVLNGSDTTTGSVAKAVKDAKDEIYGEINTNEEAVAGQLASLGGRVDALEELDAGTEIAGIKTKVGDLETWRGGLNSEHVEQPGKYIASVKQADGKVTVTYTSLPEIPDVSEFINELNANVTSDDKFVTVTVNEAAGKLTDVTVAVATGDVSEGSVDALTTAAAVKTYVDEQVTASWAWEEFN